MFSCARVVDIIEERIRYQRIVQYIITCHTFSAVGYADRRLSYQEIMPFFVESDGEGRAE
jgi:hypothetical protein